MKRIGLIVGVIAWCCFGLYAKTAKAQSLTGYCAQGAIKAQVSGLYSTNTLQGVVPLCTVTVYGAGTIYDIVAFDGTSTLTLDRPFIDPLPLQQMTASLLKYSIYQPYITAPVKDFRRWLTVSDIANASTLNVGGDRREVARIDPQRQVFSSPGCLLGLGQDTRSGSSTLGWERYELWPHPISQYLYQAWCLRKGADLVALSDTLPEGIPESLVKAGARRRCYEQAEANKDPAMVRGSCADYRFLMGAAAAQAKEELKMARLEDRDRVDIFVTTLNRFKGGSWTTTYNQTTGLAQSRVGV